MLVAALLCTFLSPSAAPTGLPRGVPQAAAEAGAQAAPGWLRRLARAAREAAADGHGAAARAALAEYRALGASGAEAGELAAAIEAAVAEHAVRLRLEGADRDAGAVRKHERAFAVLAAQLGRAGTGGDAGERFAAAALRIDPECKPALELLSGRLQPVRDAAREREIAVALQAARTLRFEVERIEPGDATLRAIARGPVAAVRYQGLVIESVLPGAQLEATLQDLLRALAFSNWLLHDELEPRVKPGLTLHVSRRAEYVAFVKQAHEDGRIGAGERQLYMQADGATLSAWHDGERVYKERIDRGSSAELAANCLLLFDDALPLWLTSDHDPPVPLWAVAGHAHYVGLVLLDHGLARWATQQQPETTSAPLGDAPEFQLQKAGLKGVEEWFVQRVLEGRDPPLATCLLDDIGRFQGDPLLKSASVMECLHRTGRAAGFLGAYAARRQAEREGSDRPRGKAARIEAALEQPLPELEQDWRRWLLGPDRGSVIGILRHDASLAAQDRGTVQLFEELNRARTLLGRNPVAWNAGLARGAADLAAALRESEADSAALGTSGLEAVWAASRALLSRAGPERCIEEWLAGAYTRLPLVHPGLLQAGAAARGRLCVLDAGSVVDRSGSWWAAYPADGQPGVPLRKAEEPVNPVPARKDQRSLGYPVTLQLGDGWLHPEVEMRLFRVEGSALIPIAAFESAPDAPGNPARVPESTWFLVPKKPLKADRAHEVQARIGERDVRWRFRTGS